MTRATIITLPKCADGLCAWRGCRHMSRSVWFTWRVRFQPTRIRFCEEHRKLVMGNSIGVVVPGSKRAAMMHQEAA